MTLEGRIHCLSVLGSSLNDLANPTITELIYRAESENPWFSKSNILLALTSIRDHFLSKRSLVRMAEIYKLDDFVAPKRIGLVLAGNIPLVGFHDVLCSFLVGHISVIKYSEKDKALMQYLIQSLIHIEPAAAAYFVEVTKLTNYDAVIATGSNNTAQHFEYYFKHVPNIIRRNRNSIAVITGEESIDDLKPLGDDIFAYFGLGCRNVSHISVPKGYDITQLFEVLKGYDEVKNHNKYKNNYDYNVALLLLNKEPFLQSDMVLLKESDQIISRIGSVHYRYYDSQEDLAQWISNHQSEIQCIVTSKTIDSTQTVDFGAAQSPTIDTYADGIDTVQFLLSI
jgi:hypothetical protein